MKKPQYFLFFIFLILSCMTTPVYYETFFTDEGNLQYYMRKAEMKGKEASGEVDFTIRIGRNAEEEAIFNCSIIMDSKDEVDAIFFIVDGQPLDIKEINVIYTKKKMVFPTILNKYYIKTIFFFCLAGIYKAGRK